MSTTSNPKPHHESIDAYIDFFPKEVGPKLQEMREIIKAAAPELEETISYNIPTFTLDGKYLVYFSANKEHIGFYPYPAEDPEFKRLADAGGFESFKGTLRLPYDKPLPVDLITKVVKTKLVERQSKV
jgi:uncharacterized protein YdhG (YjbR/CyaY superfamily)